MDNFIQKKVIEPPGEDEQFLPEDTFAQETVLITGGSSGMGLGMAKGFARAGANVVLLGRSLEKADLRAKEVSEMCTGNAKAIGVSADVRNTEQVSEAFGKAEEVFGPITLLGNNAGGNFPVLAEQISTNAWRAISRIAIDGTFNVSVEFVKRCKSNNKAGAIVNNSAQYIWTGFPGDAHSASAKTAVATMSRAMAKEWKKDNIRVNCVAAGMFPHAQAEAMSVDNADVIKAYDDMVPVGRCGRMQEFGWVSAFLCSPYASEISGQVLMIDGGDNIRRSLVTPEYVPPRYRGEIWGYMR